MLKDAKTFKIVIATLIFYRIYRFYGHLTRLVNQFWNSIHPNFCASNLNKLILSGQVPSTDDLSFSSVATKTTRPNELKFWT